MTKAELIDMLAADRGLPRKTAEKVVNVVFDGMRESLCSGERIELRGFGSFHLREYDAYTGRNPRTNEPIHVQPKTLPVFRVGKSLRERVNGGS
jgi:integration host factor subunit beta